jgi:hypothetical protein
MAAIAPTADGEFIFLALEDTSAQPVIIKATRPDAAGDAITFTEAYAPAAGTAGNVAAVAGNADLMLLHGNFGSGVQVVMHTVSTGGNANISPAGLTTKVVNAAAVDPSDSDHIIVCVNTDQDLLETRDGGANWIDLNTVLGFDATALAVHWQTFPEYDIIYVVGQVTGAAQLTYTPNSGSSLSDITGGTMSAANVASLELGY